jgi:transformation/transcription domain-associated protein
MDEVTVKLIPEDTLTRVSQSYPICHFSIAHGNSPKYMLRTMEGPGELWRMRKQFALQIAGTSFMTYVISMSSRLPARFHISRRTGQIYMSELIPGECTRTHCMLAQN